MKNKRIKNPVAKFANQFNKPATHRDRKNDYRRVTKHRSIDSYAQYIFNKGILNIRVDLFLISGILTILKF